MICLFLRGAFASNQLENRDAILKGNLLTMVQPVMSTGLENTLLIFGGLNAGQIDDAGVTEVMAKHSELKFKMINRKGCTPKETPEE